MTETTKKLSNPYLLGVNRLSDVIAAIQFLGTYKFYKVGFDYWEKRIKSPPKTANKWETIFTEHPEFFRVSNEKDNCEGKQVVCLILRRARPSDFDVDSGEKVKREAKKLLTTEQKKRITREPLATSDVTALIETAIELHNRTMEQQKESRWFLPIVLTGISIAGVIIGTLLGAILSK